MRHSRLSLGLLGCAALSMLWSLGWAGESGTPARDATGDSSGSGSTSRAASAPAAVRYDRDIRPLLSDRCFRCHGPDSGKRRADLRLDAFEHATADREDGRAILPGDAAASLLLQRVSSEDPNERMPPASSNKKPLTADERELVRRWIDAGAHYEPHWSFTPPVRPPVPNVRDASWPLNAVDHFVLERLEREGITPSPAASDETLLRRVFLDLTGLPPSPEELDTYLADASADKYERWVDKLLHEEPYATRHAERMAVPWLDAARYADTCGIHKDAGRSIWPWRDWVIDAYRTNMPFDRFLTEQLAGDLLPNATTEQKIASGFNRNHVTSDEGGAIKEEYLVEYAVDRAATTSAVFLGLTMGCARCHDHKFDPITQEDFYSFYSFFNSIDEPGVYTQLSDPNRAMEPFLPVPTPAQRAEGDKLRAELAQQTALLATVDPGEDRERAAFLGELKSASGVAWAGTELVEASAKSGAVLKILDDGSALASGVNPAQDEHVYKLRTKASDLRLVSIEALTDASLPHGRVGRFENGNAVLTGVEAVATSLADPTRREVVSFEWAWADREQANGDFRVVNVLDTHDDLGWAVDAHNQPGPCAALLLADRPFGFAGGTEVTLRLQYKSTYPQHVFGRVRLGLATIAPAGIAKLPAAASGWYVAGPFPARSGAEVFDTAFGPEEDTRIDLARTFGDAKLRWSFDPGLLDGVLNNALPQGTVATYLGRRLFVPSARSTEVSLGSDDGVRLYVGGRIAFENRVDRSLKADQDKATLALERGAQTVVFKEVNTGGEAGFYWNARLGEGELAHDLVAALLPDRALSPEAVKRIEIAWRLQYSPVYRERRDRQAALEKSLADLDLRTTRTMVMQELPMPRPTFLLQRGQYDHPDKDHPIHRAVPAALGSLPKGAPADRAGLAQWMTSPENPLVARVAVNRLWELVFGTGIVRTSEDFGMQGEYPSHPELLDWLADEFRASGWDTQHILKLLVTSRAYRQSSRARPDTAESDPERRLLSSFPRNRLGAEAIRDSALFIAGLLVDRAGGASVRPYQPPGLWEEVSMPDVNTRTYVRDMGEGSWRRSLYTFWKRASPPPAMLTLDAPTREYCTIRRTTTNTALQALVLWNDEQFVEAARVLAQRTLKEAGDDRARLARMFRRCTSRAPDARELALLEQGLADFRARYSSAMEDARSLVHTGIAPVAEDLDAPELAAWTMIASSLLNLDATIVRS